MGIEGIAWLGALLSVAALVIAIFAAALVLRAARAPAGDAMVAARVAELERRVANASRRLERLEQGLERGAGPAPNVTVATTPAAAGRGVSRVGLARFDAFADTGGAQSFALALMDDGGDGVVITSLHARQTTRLYVKTIRGGIADAPLSSEEETALRRAGIAV